MNAMLSRVADSLYWMSRYLERADLAATSRDRYRQLFRFYILAEPATLTRRGMTKGKPVAKRGKEAGAKRLVRCARCFARRNVPLRAPDSRCACGGAMRDMLKRFVIGGARTPRLPTAGKIRERALGELRRVEL